MSYDLSVVEGDKNKPAVVFIHGLGMDKGVWETPDRTRVLGGRFPIQLLVHYDNEISPPGRRTAKVFLGRHQGVLRTLYHDLIDRRQTVVSWSQKRPSAGIDVAVSELAGIIDSNKRLFGSGMIIVGHSRGGLIARKFIKSGMLRPKAIITLGTPHKGSRMARWADYLKPLISFVNPFLGESEKGSVSFTVRKVLDFLASKAVRELLPDSDFFRSIDDCRINGVYYITVGGRDPALICAYRVAANGTNGAGRPSERIERVFGIPGILEKILPRIHLPDEMKKGFGDGLVSIDSSRLEWSDEHYDFDINHAEMLFDEGVRKILLNAVDKIK